MEQKRPKNQVILEGILGQRPEAKNTASNILMSRSSLAVSRKKGENFESMWVNLTAFGKTAGEFANLDKADKIRVIGRLSIDKKEDKTYVSVIVDEFEIVAKKNAAAEKEPEKFRDIPF